MARKINEETIIKINEVYLECGVKSTTAKIVGVSPSTVSKYLIPDYKSRKNKEKEIEVVFDKECKGADEFIRNIRELSNSKNLTLAQSFCELCKLTPEEYDAMAKIQEGIII